jgi:iduronate 2-sulfatase
MNRPGAGTDAVVSTLDIFPTLCDLAGIPAPDFARGVSLRPMLVNPEARGHSAVSYWKDAGTLRTATHRLIVHRDGSAELYDHTTNPGETLNTASQFPEVVKRLKDELTRKLSRNEDD